MPVVLRVWAKLCVYMTCLIFNTAATAQEGLVFRLESFLSELGYNAGTIDNTADAQTSAAILKYQQDRGLPATGGMTLQEYQALEKEIVLFRATSQGAQPKATNNSAVSIGEYRLHRLARCSGERGFIVYGYRQSIQHPKYNEVSEICWDAASGRLDSTEPQSGLTLVTTGEDSARYELLSSGSEAYKRRAFTISRNTPQAGDTIVDEVALVNHSAGATLRMAQNGHEFLDGFGFMTSSRFSPQSARAPFGVYVSIQMSVPNSLDSSACKGPRVNYAAGAPAYVSLIGTYDMRSPTEIILNPAPDYSGTAQGRMTLSVDANGEITGTASIYLENPRLAGHAPCEWLRAEVDIGLIAGSTSGQQGVRFQAVGIGKGRFTDVNGVTSPLVVKSSIAGNTLAR